DIAHGKLFAAPAPAVQCWLRSDRLPGILLQPLPERLELVLHFRLGRRHPIGAGFPAPRPALRKKIILDLGFGPGTSDRNPRNFLPRQKCKTRNRRGAAAASPARKGRDNRLPLPAEPTARISAVSRRCI